MSKQVVRFKQNRAGRDVARVAGASGAVLAPLGIAAANALVNSRGADWVLQQVATGAVRLTKAAINHIYGSVSVAAPSFTPASVPASMGVAISGSAKMNGNIRIKHRELIGSFVTADGTLTNLRVNPASVYTFPYLSGLAALYDKYKFHDLKFSIVSSSPTSAGGRWYLAWDPDSQDTHANSPLEFMAQRYSLSCSSWQSGCLSTQPQDDFRFCSYFPDTVKDDGQVLLITRGMSSQTLDLYVEYDVTLQDPEVGITSQMIYSNTFPTAGAIGNPTGPGYVTPFSPQTKNVIVVSPGTWQITYNVIGTGLSDSNPTVNGTSNYTGRWTANATGATSFTKTIALTNSDNINLTLGGTWSTVTQVALVITPVSSAEFSQLNTTLLSNLATSP